VSAERKSDARKVGVCPSCGVMGKKVGDETLEAMLTPEDHVRVGETPMRFCRTTDCRVGYFAAEGDLLIDADAIRVEVFQKSDSPQRLVCYCFEHRVSELRDEVARTGASKVPAEIAEMCKQGLDHCEETNPQGSCCLGNVNAVVKAAKADAGQTPNADDTPAPVCCATGEDGESCALPDAQAGPSEEAHDCCATEAVDPDAGVDEMARAERSDSRRGLFATGGALLAAIASSACCWLPLALVAFGASAAGVAGFFEAYRWLFLGVTSVLLAGGFYLLYRKPRCAPGSACAAPNPRLRRMNRVMLWSTTAFVLAFAAFPNYIGALLGTGDDEDLPMVAPPSAEAFTQTYAIEGMTCEGCATNLQRELAKLPGVEYVEVSYPERRATVRFRSRAQADAEAVDATAQAAGYHAQLNPETPGA